MHGRVETGIWLFLAAIQIHAPRIASVMSIRNAVRIEQAYNFEDKCTSRGMSALVTDAEEEINNAIAHVTCGCLARMHTTRHDEDRTTRLVSIAACNCQHLDRSTFKRRTEFLPREYKGLICSTESSLCPSQTCCILAHTPRNGKRKKHLIVDTCTRGQGKRKTKKQ